MHDSGDMRAGRVRVRERWSERGGAGEVRESYVSSRCARARVCVWVRKVTREGDECVTDWLMGGS